MAEPLIVIEGAQEVLDLIAEVPEDLYDAARVAYRDTVNTVQKNVQKRVRNGTPLFSRTGELRRSFHARTFGTNLETLGSGVATESPYAPIHEKGGTIKAKRAYSSLPGGPYLNIPLSANKTPAGVTRHSARTVFAGGGFIIKSKKGTFLVMSGSGQLMFVLKRSVKIPERLGFVDVAEKEIPVLLTNIGKLIVKEIDD